MKLKAKNYSSQDIEKHVANKYGLTPDQKAHTIAGTRRTRTLGASDSTVFWGIPCTITDDPTPAKSNIPKPDRGALHEGGINKPKKRKNG